MNLHITIKIINIKYDFKKQLEARQPEQEKYSSGRYTSKKQIKGQSQIY